MNQKLNILSNKKGSECSDSNNDRTIRSEKTRKRFHLTEALITIGIPIGFLVVIILLFGDQLIPAKKVTTVRVLAKEIALASGTTAKSVSETSTIPSSQGKSLFQASGWIEADPFYHRAPALINGIVKDVYVLEGEAVQQGQLLATLIDDDTQLQLSMAKFEVRSRQAALESQNHKLELILAEVQTLEKRIAMEQARLAEVKDVADRKRLLGIGVISEEEVTQAILREKTQLANLAALESHREQLTAQIEIETSNLSTAEALLGIAQTKLAQAELAQSRTRIYAPISGRIQRLYAAPGQKKVLNSDHIDSITIATLYDPTKLQARIDVPLEEASKVFVGQFVSIRTHFLADSKLEGIVTRIAGESDIQRNTLQVKIALKTPELRLRPEMLCRAEFYGQTRSSISGKTSNTAYQALHIPSSTLTSQNENQAVVFKIDEQRKRVLRQTIEISAESTDGFFQVLSGLKAGDILITDPQDLKHNQRVKFQ